MPRSKAPPQPTPLHVLLRGALPYMAEWARLCAAWDAGERPEVREAICGGGRLSLPGRPALFISWGPLGVNRYHDPEAVTLAQAFRARLNMPPWEPPQTEEEGR